MKEEIKLKDEAWRCWPLGRYVSVLGGYAFKSKLFKKSGLPVIRISNLNNDYVDPTDCVRVSKKDVGKGVKYKLQAGDTLMAMSGATTGKLGFVSEHLQDTWLLNQRVGAFRINDTSNVFPKYLRSLLMSFHFQNEVWKLAWGAAQPNISGKQIESIKIPFPPLSDQKRIAGILDVADALRATRRESLAQLDTLLQATFLYMFGDPVTNPKGLEKAALGEVIKVKSGVGLTAKEMATDGEFPVYGGNGINGYHNAYMFEEPRVVLGRVGVYCGAVHLTKPKAWITDNALYVHEFLRPIDRTYLVAALKLANLNQYAGRAAQPLISGSRIYPVNIIIPPLDFQNQFATIVECVEQQKAFLRTHLAELDILFASLQSRAFSGDL